jgi:UDPglucose 6-dehydrogenase
MSANPVSENPLDISIGFAGLSHLGMVYSAATVARGFSVVAFDDRPGLVEELSASRFPVTEPGLAEIYREHGAKLYYTSDARLLAQCSLVFVALDVSTNDANESDLEPLKAMLAKVTPHLYPGATLVIMSQVPPGFSRQLAARLPSDAELYYQVETLVFGNAVARAVHPERIIIGSGEVTSTLPGQYARYLEAFDCPILRMSYESAELCKIAINCFLVSSIATSNTLAEICERIGADWREIVPALRMDQRIGPHAYLTPGLGIAGGNLERDLVTVQRLASENGCDAGVVTAWQRNSQYRKDWVLGRLSDSGLLHDPQQTCIGVWGLAYKQDTHSTKNSPSIALLRALHSYSFQAYDPAAQIEAEQFPHVRVCSGMEEAARGADVLLVMTPWREFAAAQLECLLPRMRGRVVVDPYGVLPATRCQQLGYQYQRMGA